MMAAKREQIIQNGSLKENNLLHRIWHLPVVSSAFRGLQKMYSTAKDVHPLVASICSIYEQGLWSVSSLAAWSTKPVVQKLKPQFAAVNALACRGLDHLEQKIPALNQPVEKVTSDLKESILTHGRSAMHFATDTLDRALELAAKSYKQSKISPREVTEYAKSSRVVQLTEAGINVMTSRLEKLVNLFLPRAEHKSAENTSNEISSTSTFGKISALAAHVSQQVCQQTIGIIQHTKDKGRELAVWIPDAGGLGRQSAANVLHLLSEARNRTSGWLHKQLGRGLEEKKKRTAGDKSSKPVENGTFVQNLQAASLAIVLSVRKSPYIIWNLLGQVLQVSPRATGSGAGAEVDMLKGTLHNLTSSLLGTLASCIPFLKVSEKETETTSAAHSESGQEEEDIEPEEKGIPYYLLGSRRSSRGHHPLFFLNLDDPLPSEQTPRRRHSKAFEAEYTMCQRAAFSPYKEANSKRRMSEGMCRPNTEVLCTRAHYRGLISATFKKD